MVISFVRRVPGDFKELNQIEVALIGKLRERMQPAGGKTRFFRRDWRRIGKVRLDRVRFCIRSRAQ